MQNLTNQPEKPTACNVSRKDLAEEAFSRLQGAIVSGELRPNQRLVESELAGKLGMSRTPIREAFSRLQATAYVTRLPGGGLIVADHSPSQIRELFEVRKALEVAATKLACQRLSAAKMLEIEEHCHHTEEAIQHHNVEGFIKANSDFHEFIYACCENARLIELIMTFRDHYFLRRIVRTFTKGDWRTTMRAHRQLVEALRKRDPRRAGKVLEQHLETVQLRALQRL